MIGATKHARYVAGVPDGAHIDLSLVKLPEGALMFPSFAGDTIYLTRRRLIADPNTYRFQ
jgi:hypothetical protein